MITKFKTIKNLAVFEDFAWDIHVRDKANNVATFKNINIFYGRNYSGKTTLSRILRGFETGAISDRYDNPEFLVQLNDTTTIDNTNLKNHTKTFRTFNEDFVRDNLKFINDPNESIEPFAILGGNATIEDDIKTLRDALGQNELGKETQLYASQIAAKKIAATAQRIYDDAVKRLDAQLTTKATDKNVGIKYNFARFGEQNYTKVKLESDISTVLSKTFKPITNERVKELEKLLQETATNKIPPTEPLPDNFSAIAVSAKELITKKIGASDKIDELIKDAILNRWVKEGKQIHQNKKTECAFCGNHISDSRWGLLDKHFDEESEALDKDIDSLIKQIEQEKKDIERYFLYNSKLFYSKYQLRVSRLLALSSGRIKNYSKELDSVSKQLKSRKDDLINSGVFIEPIDLTPRLRWIHETYEKVRQDSNNYTIALSNEQIQAKQLLRYKEVHSFTETIKYSDELKSISTLKVNSDKAAQDQLNIEKDIREKEAQIAAKKRLLNDEEKGALKVNEYLNDFFGHGYLSLQAVDQPGQSDEEKKIRFEIIRNDKKAHNLSEGECSLIAFCYFMAKLDDIDTHNSKPILWIDDPISSLDNNHIFFIYSLINAEIVVKKRYEQLFVSTHNLDFLKYLKRLPSTKNTKEYFIVTRDGTTSKIKLMPAYLKEYVTEFNYLFHQIYKCSIADNDNEEDHHLYYNFGNNTRKFLEAFLYYRYPSTTENDEKLEKFFGAHPGTALADRVNNEYSHLEALFERSMRPIEVPEMKKVAQFILKKISEKDQDQYESLLKSIGVNN